VETLISLLIGIGVTFFFLRRYLKKLTSTDSEKPSGSSEPVSAKATSGRCPRCGHALAGKATFCSSCGAAIALWSVHRAAVVESNGDSAEAGHPRPVINATLCIGCGSCVEECPEAGTLELVSGKAILANPERCTGQSKCVNVCPTSAISLAFGNALQTLKVPSVDENFETNVEGVFIVGELGGMALIKTAINEGRLAMDQVRRRLEQDHGWQGSSGECRSREDSQEMAETAESEAYDVVIVGAGPAGLSASLSAAQLGVRYLTLEQGEVASTIRQYPRQKFLMAEPIEMPLYGSLYVGDGTKEALLSVWESIIANTGVHVRTNQRVTGITRCPEKRMLLVSTDAGTVEARFVILAMGKRGMPRKLGIPGEDLGKVAYRLIEADSYQDNDILVVGGGDSAVEAALALSRSGKNRVTLSYRGSHFKRIRERNKVALSEAEEAGRVRVLRNSRVLEVGPERAALESDGQRVELPNQYVFVLIGGESPETFLRKTGIEIVEKAISA
jgi:thioredoxin reductase (NADPH)